MKLYSFCVMNSFKHDSQSERGHFEVKENVGRLKCSFLQDQIKVKEKTTLKGESTF